MNTTRLVATGLLGLLPLALACGNAKTTGVASATSPAGPAEGLEHEPCDESGHRVEMLDTNNDGKPDIRRVFDKNSQREVCRAVDLNQDGKPDLYEYFDASGAIRRREFCYDDSGVVNAIEHYDAGRLTQREYDTSGLHKLDTWDYFEPGLPLDAKTGRPVHPSRRERDTSGDGRVDQWWTWEGGKLTIARDTRGDGKPDLASVVVLEEETGPGDAGAPALALPSAVADAGAPTPLAAGDAGVAAALADGGSPSKASER